MVTTLLLLGWILGSQNPGIGPVREVATPAGANSGEPNLTVGKSGVFLSWIERNADNTQSVKYALFRGNRFMPARIIHTAPDLFVNWADFPMLIELENGTLLAHWLQRNGRGTYAYGVRASTSRDGVRWSAPFTVHSDTSQAEHGFVSLFRAGPSRAGVIWLDGYKYGAAQAAARAAGKAASEVEAEMTVRYRTIGANGTLGAESEIDARACDCCQTSVALTSRGPVVVFRDRSEGEIRDIAVSRMINGKWSAPQRVHADNWVINACPVNGPSIDARGARVAVAWFTAARDTSRVNVAFSSDAAARFGAPVRVDDGAPAGRVDTQLLDDGSALVTWLERVDKGAEVRLRRIWPNGRRSAAVTIAKSTGERPSGFPQMVRNGSQLVFAWTDSERPARVRVATAEIR